MVVMENKTRKTRCQHTTEEVEQVWDGKQWVCLHEELEDE